MFLTNFSFAMFLFSFSILVESLFHVIFLPGVLQPDNCFCMRMSLLNASQKKRRAFRLPEKGTEKLGGTTLVNCDPFAALFIGR